MSGIGDPSSKCSSHRKRPSRDEFAKKGGGDTSSELTPDFAAWSASQSASGRLFVARPRQTCIFPARGTAARARSRFSIAESEAPSPVVPAKTTPAHPSDSNRANNRASEAKSSDPESVNGVTAAGWIPAEITLHYAEESLVTFNPLGTLVSYPQ